MSQILGKKLGTNRPYDPCKYNLRYNPEQKYKIPNSLKQLVKSFKEYRNEKPLIFK